MPRGDRTGPVGNGPQTGRGAGYCSGWGAPGFTNRGPGMGFGFGFGGRGRGWRHMFFATGQPGWARTAYTPPTKDQELDNLKAEADFLSNQLSMINQRIDDLKTNE